MIDINGIILVFDNKDDSKLSKHVSNKHKNSEFFITKIYGNILVKT